MKTSRLEAFSDAVLAIIITIMVLELEVPHEPTLQALAESATGLLTYLLSFVYLGIYWNNHHHLFQLVGRVRGGVLWANLHLLLWLSLVPFTTAWMDEQFAPTPVMVYGDDVTHLVTEEGIAHLHRCATLEEREQAIRGVAGYTPVGLARDRRAVENLRDRGIVQRPQDLGIDARLASRDLLAAKSIKDLVRWSGGLYQPPRRFRNW